MMEASATAAQRMGAEPGREEEDVAWLGMTTVYMIGGQVQAALVAAVLQVGRMAALEKNSSRFQDFSTDSSSWIASGEKNLK